MKGAVMSKFSIHSGTRSAPCKETGVMLPHPQWTVLETRRGRVVEARHFFDQGEAHEYVQRAMNMDRDFAMEGR
jgi:hypothetical protein